MQRASVPLLQAYAAKLNGIKHATAPRSQVALGNALLAKFHFDGAEPDEAQLRGKLRFQVKLGNES